MTDLIDNTVEGGRYEVNGRLVNAEGEPIGEAKTNEMENDSNQAEPKPKGKSK